MTWTIDPREALRVTDDFDLVTFDRGGKPGFDGKKADGEALMAERGDLLAELQERLFAEGRAGGKRSVLVVLQGLDTAGKGGIAKHVMGLVDPQGVQMRSFGVPTKEEASHHFLWRIRKALPTPGRIGLFDRSHYEDVLVQRVDEIVPEEVWRKRYTEINRFEEKLVESGTTVLKFALMVDRDEQGLRLMERLDRPDKRWKFSRNDLTTRGKWDDYQEAYADVFRFTNTEVAPWYVLPANRKWYSRLAVTEILARTLIEMRPKWPKPRYDIAKARRDLAATMSPEALAESAADTEATVVKAIESNTEVRTEAIELMGGTDEHHARAAALREEWETELAETLAQKAELAGTTVEELQAADEDAKSDKQSKKDKKKSKKNKDKKDKSKKSKKKGKDKKKS